MRAADREGRWASAVSLAALAACVGVVLALHAARMDLDWRVRYMSEYAAGPTRAWMALAFVLLGAASLGVAARAPRLLGGGAAGAASAALLAAWGAGVGALAWHPAGRAHEAIVWASQAALVGGILPFLTRHGRDPRWRGFLRATLACGGLALGTWLLVPPVGPLPWPGVAQRAAGVAVVAWLAMAATRAAEARGPGGSARDPNAFRRRPRRLP